MEKWEFMLFPFCVSISDDVEPKLIRPDGMFVAVLKDTVGGFEFFNFMTISSSRQEAEDKLNQFKKQIPEFFRHCVPQRIAEIRVEEL